MWWLSFIAKACVVAMCLLSAPALLGQTPSNTEQLIEETVTNAEGQLEDESLIDDFSTLVTQPIPINDTLANWSPLLSNGLLTPYQQEQLVGYLREFGPLLSKTELLAVPGLPEGEARRLFPYVTVRPVESAAVPFINQLSKGRNSLLLRYQSILETQKGYALPDSVTNRYLGDRAKVYFRYRHQYGQRLSYGLVADKDPGESLFNGKAGFDFYSAHFFTAQPEKGGKLAVGDYELKIGQGLLHWNGFSLGKGVSSARIHRAAPVLRPFNSANEFNFMRGIALERNLGPLKITPWVSHRQLDASFEADSTGQPSLLRTIREDGLHRTVGELKNKGVFTLTNTGVNATYEGQHINLGLAASYSKFSTPVEPREQPYTAFDFRGDAALGVSMHYSAVLKQAYLFGETAVDQEGNLASLHGVQAFINPGVKAALAIRSYAKDYSAIHADGFAESTGTQNEQGLYLGFEFNPSNQWFVNTYVDVFR
ncbi:MAG: general secretion pathway protein GspK, partial [Saprospiraceae bacterium]|nr:general secretion pathway protein GspK [Saprospiraceae bacterium]